VKPVPQVSLQKVATTSSVSNAGDEVDYTFTVQNLGNVTLQTVELTDDQGEAIALSGCDKLGPLAVGESKTCTGVYHATQAEIDAGSVVNNAEVEGWTPNQDPTTDAPAAVDKDNATVPVHQNPHLTLTKDTTATSVEAPGEVIPYTFTVTNDGNITINDVSVIDHLDGVTLSGCDDLGSLDPNGTATCTGTYTVQPGDMDLTAIDNTATAQGWPAGTDPTTDKPITADADKSVPLDQQPSMKLTKDAAPTEVTVDDTTVTYSFTVENTGNVTLHDIVVTDPMLGTDPICTIDTLAAGATSDPADCQAVYTVTQADRDAGTIHNAAVAKGQSPNPDNPPADAPADKTVTVDQNPAFIATKTADKTTVSSTDDVITYSFTVQNTGDVTLSNVVVTDPMLSADPICTIATLPVGTTSDPADCQMTYQVTAADLIQPTIHNVATVTANGPDGNPVTPQNPTQDVTVTPQPGLSIAKSVAPATGATAGDTLTYTFVVTNTGNVPLTNVTVNEATFSGTGAAPVVDVSNCSTTSGDVTDTDGVLAMQPGAVVTCTAQYEVTADDAQAGTVDNTATATGTDPSGNDITSQPSQAQATVVLGSSPTIPAGPSTTPTEPSTTPTTPTQSASTSATPTGAAPVIPTAPTGGSVVAGGFTVLPWAVAGFGLVALAWFGLRRREERAE
jgi:uncharacterized repeat protein (TIGR01451 family)